MTKIDLDARELEHPKPLEMSMKILHNLDDSSYLYMIHRKNPIPLLDFAKGLNLQIVTKEDNTQIWHILISPNQDIDLHSYLSPEAFGV